MNDRYSTDESLVEPFSSPLDIEFQMPVIQLVSLTLHDNNDTLEKSAYATAPRFFTLQKDWKLTVNQVEYMDGIEGTIIIPKEVDGDPVIFDGSSLPLPWLVSLLTLGTLRPMGVILTASILHRFAYQYGYLLVENNEGEMEQVEIPRDLADQLFKDVFLTTTGLKPQSFLALFFTKVGWALGMKYNGRRFNGRPPIVSLIILAATLTIFWIILWSTWFTPLLLLTFLSYLSFYLASILFLQKKGSQSDAPTPAPVQAAAAPPAPALTPTPEAPEPTEDITIRDDEEEEDDEMEEEPKANTKARKSLKVKRTPRKNT